MKTVILGLLYIVFSAVLFFGFLLGVVAPIVFHHGIIDDTRLFLIGAACLPLGIYSFLLGSAIKNHKKWGWYAGIGTVLLALIGNIYFFISNHQLAALTIVIFLDGFALYALFSEKYLFFDYNKEPRILSQIPTTYNPPTNLQ